MTELYGSDFLVEKIAYLFDSSRDGLWVMSENEDVYFYNNTFYKNFDIPLVNSKLSDWVALVHPEDKELFERRVSSHKNKKIEKVVSRYRALNKSGEYSWIEATGVIVDDNDKSFMVGCHADITLEMKMHNKLQYLAYHDSESGLYNRQKWIEDVSKSGLHGANVSLKVNNINDYLRFFGESFLKRLVIELKFICSELGISSFDLYRIRDDVFSFRLNGDESKKIIDVVSGILNSKGLKDTFQTSDLSNIIYVSGFHEKDVINEKPINRLLKSSDYACLIKDTYIYNVSNSGEVERYFSVRDVLNKSFLDKEFYVVMQPIIDIKNNRVVSYESLARWDNYFLGSVSPIEFISVAEDIGLIFDLGYFLFNKSCEGFHKIKVNTKHEVKLNFNFSVVQLKDRGVHEKMINLVKKNNLFPSDVVLEITESHYLDDDFIALNSLEKLRISGFNISIDDFGAGYSSLTSLYKINASQVKIDKQLVWSSLTSKACRSLVELLVQYAREQRIQLVAEGVESQELSEYLSDLGIHLLQGFALSKPKLPEYWQGG
ncbi:EAL domain-containing protein [Vibrio alginolyticus]